MEDMEPEQSIFCNQARLLVEGLGHQPSHKNLLLMICLASKMCWGKGDTEIVGVASQCLIQLETHAMGGEPTSDTAQRARSQRLNSTETYSRTKHKWQIKKKTNKMIPNDILL